MGGQKDVDGRDKPGHDGEAAGQNRQISRSGLVREEATLKPAR
jgi:hypothetical protein